jgi:tetratricopeptide (TPR) repeat protein
MTFFEELSEKIESIRESEEAGLVELRRLMLEIDEFISSDEYSELPLESRTSIQGVRKELKNRIRTKEDEEEMAVASDPSEKTAPETGISDIEMESRKTSSSKGEGREYNPMAEQQMETAEKMFYSGRYSEAINLFDRVLQLEPNWDRARQHRSEAENYLRTGYIPAVALPSEAASAYGKAQSAARVGRFADALSLIERAQDVLREVGIQRWQEGQEFAQKLQENIDAENVYHEGLELFKHGQIDEAIERVETALRATGLPKYEEKARAYRGVKETLRNSNEVLGMANIEPKALSQIKVELDNLLSEYGENAVFNRLRERMTAAIPRVVSPLKEKTRSLKAQAERAPTLEGSLYLANQAKTMLDQIRNLEGFDESLDRLQNEVDRLVSSIHKLDEELQMAAQAYDKKQNWPSAAARLSSDVRSRFPNDPGVMDLSRSLRKFFWTLLGLRAGGVMVSVLILVGLFNFGMGRFNAYQLALTPTATATATATATSTPTSTMTPTMTPTDTPTPTPTMTPTPMYAVSQRELWVRSGCYEGFNAVGKIPVNSEIRFMPDERRFDNFNRECVLVQFTRLDGSAVIGWVLMADLGTEPVVVSTPSP